MSIHWCGHVSHIVTVLNRFRWNMTFFVSEDAWLRPAILNDFFWGSSALHCIASAMIVSAAAVALYSVPTILPFINVFLAWCYISCSVHTLLSNQQFRHFITWPYCQYHQCLTQLVGIVIMLLTHSGDVWFRSHPGPWLSWQVFVVFLNRARQMLL